MSTFKVKNPATGEWIADLPKDTEESIQSKIIDGSKSFENWKKTDAYYRSHKLKQWASVIRENATEVASIITKESGKPIKESKGEVEYACSYIDWFAEEAKRIYGRTVPSNSKDKKIIISKEPVGLVVGITPWNFPAAMLTRKVAPALASGCTFIAKPPKETPLTTIKLVELAHKVGIPSDVLQYVLGDGSFTGEVFTKSKLVRKITFTGSTEVGKILVANSAETMKRVSMELGGHAPLIIHKDSDLEIAVTQTIASKFRNAGQTCISANRVIVHENVVEEYSKMLSAEVGSLKVGYGEEDIDIGPVINKSSYEKILEQIEDSIDKGATILHGNKYETNHEKETYFVHPTVLTGISSNMKIMQEETFGPVIPIVTYSKLSEAIEIANNTPYGLAAYFFTNDYRVGTYLHDNLNFGVIGWNDGAPSAAHAPFGGMKDSGVGREGGAEGIEDYLETKYMSVGNLSADII